MPAEDCYRVDFNRFAISRVPLGDTPKQTFAHGNLRAGSDQFRECGGSKFEFSFIRSDPHLTRKMNLLARGRRGSGAPFVLNFECRVQRVMFLSGLKFSSDGLSEQCRARDPRLRTQPLLAFFSPWNAFQLEPV